MTINFIRRMAESYINTQITEAQKEAFPNVTQATDEILKDFIRYLEGEK